MIGLEDISNIRVPRSLALQAIWHLRQVGLKRFEGLALWAGVRQGEVFQVTQTVIPAQKGIRSRDGVAVAIGPEELHRLNVWLYENKLMLVAQLHSHPGEAYHSETDDEFPVATVVGSVSIVVPDFARHQFSLPTCAVYRLSGKGRWEGLTVADAADLISITD
jgi:hypothetical protein